MNHASIPGPDTIHREVLSNGLRVWVYENFETQTVALTGYVPGGAINEGPDEKGLASLTAIMLRRGTQHHDFDAINETVESVGASFHFDSGKHTLGIDAYALAEDLDLVLDLLAESLLLPAFPADELEKTRTRLLTRLEEQKHSTRAMASITFNQQIYPPDHPYRASLDAQLDALHRLQREDLLRFYQTKVTPQGGVLVLVGAIRAEDAFARLEAALGAWHHPHAHPDLSTPPTPTLTETREKQVRVQGKSQSDIILGWPGIPRTHPDYTPMLVTNAILGRFGLGGRLGNRIREQMGLAYYAHSTFTVNRGAGTWRLAAGVHPHQVERAVQAMKDEVVRMREEKVSPQELEDVQRYLVGSLALRLETNAGIAGNLLNMAWYGLGLDYLQRYGDQVRAVTIDEVQRIARRYLHPQRYALAIAGPPPESDA